MDAFGDQAKTSDFLPLAEEAVRACQGDAAILSLAATAALFDGRAERAVVFLKRLAKRFSQNDTDYFYRRWHCGSRTGSWQRANCSNGII